MVEGNFKTPDYLSLTHILSPRKLPGGRFHSSLLPYKWEIQFPSLQLLTHYLPAPFHHHTDTSPIQPPDISSRDSLKSQLFTQYLELHMIPMQENGRSPLPLLPQSDDPLPSFYLSSKPNNHPPPD